MMLLFRCANESCVGNYSVKALFPMFHLPYSPGYMYKCPVCGQLGVLYPKFDGKETEEPDDELMKDVRKKSEQLTHERLLESMLGGQRNVDMEQKPRSVLL